MLYSLYGYFTVEITKRHDRGEDKAKVQESKGQCFKFQAREMNVSYFVYHLPERECIIKKNQCSLVY